MDRVFTTHFILRLPVDMARVRKRKELMRAEVDKNDIVHRWLRDHVKPERWDKIAGAFPHGGKYSPQQQWVLMQEDAKSPFRYQQYGITVKLNPIFESKTLTTFQNFQDPDNVESKTLTTFQNFRNCEAFTVRGCFRYSSSSSNPVYARNVNNNPPK